MKILITGSSGFVGRHAIAEFTRQGHDCVSFSDTALASDISVLDHQIFSLDDVETMDTFIAKHKPDAALHLAGISFVPVGWEDPAMVMRVNAGGTINLLESCRKHSPKTRILCVTTAHVYGVNQTVSPIPETAPLWPDSVYGVSKVAADLATLAYAEHYGMHVMTARPHNHIGPGQNPNFAIPSFASQLKQIAAGEAEPVMHVGNLESTCDFTDVRDVARAYHSLLTDGHAGGAYNIATGSLTSIQHALDLLIEISGVSPTIEIDPNKFRPADHWPLLDVTRIHTDTNWSPKISLQTSLRDVYAAV